MPRTKGAKDWSRTLRGGLKRFYMMHEDSGKPISTMWQELYEADKVQFMRLASAFDPKDCVELDDLPEDLTASEIAMYILRGSLTGQIAPDDAQKLLSAVNNAEQISRLDEIEQRLEALQHAKP
jgi:hypothetical protein